MKSNLNKIFLYIFENKIGFQWKFLDNVLTEEDEFDGLLYNFQKNSLNSELANRHVFKL